MQTFDWSEILKYAGITALVVVGLLVFLLLLLAPPLLIKWMATKDFFFTIVKEGTAKSIEVNGQFNRMVMALQGHRFGREGTGPNDPNYWDVVRGEDQLTRWIRNIPFYGNLVGGVRWLGVWGIASTKKYKFRWISYDYPRDESGKITSHKKQPVSHAEDLDYILIVPDVFFMSVDEAETRTKVKKAPSPSTANNPPTTDPQPEFEPGIPVDLWLLLTTTIRNPYKAIYSVQNWLEITTNQRESDVREFVGTKEFEELFGEEKAASATLSEYLEGRTAELLDRFGVEVSKTQIQSVQPGGELANQYRETSIALWNSDQLAKAKIRATDAEVDRIRREMDESTKTPERVHLRGLELLGKTKLTTIVGTGTGQMPIGITLPTNQPEQPSAPEPTKSR
jgi:hypothetical protein